MYKQIIILLLISSALIFCKSTKKVSSKSNIITNQKNDSIYVYKDNKQVSTLLNNTIGHCETCYVYETLSLFDKELTFIIPVEVTNKGKRFDKLFSIKKKKVKDQQIVELNRKSIYINGIKLYISDKKKSLKINSFITYENESYKKKIGQNDYEHVPAVKICTISDYNDVIKDTINTLIHPIFNKLIEENKCIYCENESDDFETCIKNIKE